MPIKHERSAWLLGFLSIELDRLGWTGDIQVGDDARLELSSYKYGESYVSRRSSQMLKRGLGARRLICWQSVKYSASR